MVLCLGLAKQTQEILFSFLLKSPGTSTHTHTCFSDPFRKHLLCSESDSGLEKLLGLPNCQDIAVSAATADSSTTAAFGQDHETAATCYLVPHVVAQTWKTSTSIFFPPHFWRKGHIDFRCQKDGLCRISVWGRQIGPSVWLTDKRLREREAFWPPPRFHYGFGVAKSSRTHSLCCEGGGVACC